MKRAIVLLTLPVLIWGCAQTVEITDFTPYSTANYDGASAQLVNTFNANMAALTARVEKKADDLNPVVKGVWWWDFCTATAGLIGTAATASYSLASKPVQARNAGVITGIVVSLSTGVKEASEITGSEKMKSDDLSKLQGVLEYARARFQALDPDLRAGGDAAKMAAADEQLAQLNIMIANAGQ